MTYFLAIIPCSICFGVAGALALYSLSGWGWFLFAGVLCFPSLRTGVKEVVQDSLSIGDGKN